MDFGRSRTVPIGLGVVDPSDFFRQVDAVHDVRYIGEISVDENDDGKLEEAAEYENDAHDHPNVQLGRIRDPGSNARQRTEHGCQCQ